MMANYEMEGRWKLPPLSTAINQLARENQYSPPTLACWQYSGVIKIVTIDKSRWMEHFLPVLLSSEHCMFVRRCIHVCVRGANKAPYKCAFWWGQAKKYCYFGKALPLHPRILLTPSPTIINGSLPLSRTVKRVKWLGHVWSASEQMIIKTLI